RSMMHLLSVDENGVTTDLQFNNWEMGQTDDRGIYRIYGLPAGRYLSYVGAIHNQAKHKYPKTFYPDTTDQKLAKIIEVKEGAEITGIDIHLGAAENTYEAAGRVVDATTGQPLAQVSVTCLQAPDGKSRYRFGTSAISDLEGAFKVSGLSSGSYELYLQSRSGIPVSSEASLGNDYYSEKTRFEVNDSDVSGLEIKAIRGSTITGVVVIEGDNDPSIIAKMQQMTIFLHVTAARRSDTDDMGAENHGVPGARIEGDGAFRITGVAPGSARFALSGGQGSSLAIRRIERDGVVIRSALEIGRGELISGIRIVTVPANGTIRGQVEIARGKVPDGWELNIWATPVSSTSDSENPYMDSGGKGATADGKGQFMIEGLTAGEYELRLEAMVRVSQNRWETAPGTNELNQRVTVSSGAETPVKFTLELPRELQEKRR
ncbi:MAG: carboxypeptidase regulatory-like domain-containing protein, partial [Blastocatellia bacterium]|nr:carboxypeptidase regulatory-like domain-containing protein [Blastocatellia bacterium]